MSEDKLTSFLKTGSDWSRLKTSISGIYVLKMPAYRNTPARLAVELNPADSTGSPTKKRGLVLRSKTELIQFKELFQFDKLLLLLEGVDKVNPEMKKPVAGKPGEVLEI